MVYLIFRVISGTGHFVSYLGQEELKALLASRPTEGPGVAYGWDLPVVGFHPLSALRQYGHLLVREAELEEEARLVLTQDLEALQEETGELPEVVSWTQRDTALILWTTHLEVLHPEGVVYARIPWEEVERALEGA